MAVWKCRVNNYEALWVSFHRWLAWTFPPAVSIPLFCTSLALSCSLACMNIACHLHCTLWFVAFSWNDGAQPPSPCEDATALLCQQKLWMTRERQQSGNKTDNALSGFVFLWFALLPSLALSWSLFLCLFLVLSYVSLLRGSHCVACHSYPYLHSAFASQPAASTHSQVPLPASSYSFSVSDCSFIIMIIIAIIIIITIMEVRLRSARASLSTHALSLVFCLPPSPLSSSSSSSASSSSWSSWSSSSFSSTSSKLQSCPFNFVLIVEYLSWWILLVALPLK